MRQGIYRARWGYGLVVGALICVMVPAYVQAQKDQGYYGEIAGNIKGIDTTIRSQEIKTDFGSNWSEVRNESSTGGGNYDSYGASQLFFLKGEAFWGNLILQSTFSWNRALSSEIHSSTYDTTSPDPMDSSYSGEMPQTNAWFIGGGYRWYYKGAFPWAKLLLGGTRVGHSGYGGDLDGSTTFVTVGLELNPMFSLSRNVDLGLRLEGKIGVPVLMRYTEIYGKSSDDFEQPGMGGMFLEMRSGLQLYVASWGMIFQLLYHRREVNASIDITSTHYYKYQLQDESFLQFGVGYYYSRPRYNEL